MHGTTVQISAMAPDFANGDEYTFNDGTADLEAQSSTTPETVIITITRVKGGTAALRINGVQADSGSAGSGTLENAVFYFGSNATPGNYIKGNAYAGVVYCGAFDAGDVAAIEDAVAAIAGVSI
jgi:hypothetical protein